MNIPQNRKAKKKITGWMKILTNTKTPRQKPIQRIKKNKYSRCVGRNVGYRRKIQK